MKNKLIITLLIIVGILGAFIGGTIIGGKKTDNKIDSAVIESSINNIAEIATVEYNYTNFGKFENEGLEFYGYIIPFTSSKYIVTYEGVIKAGYDFTKVTATLKGENEIIIQLPEAKILSHEIDYDSLEIIDETYSIFNPVKITDYTQFYNDQSKAMEQKAIDKGILKQARINAENTVTALIKASYPELKITFQ